MKTKKELLMDIGVLKGDIEGLKYDLESERKKVDILSDYVLKQVLKDKNPKEQLDCLRDYCHDELPYDIEDILFDKMIEKRAELNKEISIAKKVKKWLRFV